MTESGSSDTWLWEDRTWVWLRVGFIALCLGVAIALSGYGCGCAPQAPANIRATESQLHSVVTLVRRHVEIDPIDFPSTDDEPADDGISMSWVGYCNAFAIERRGELVLATAAHCAPKRKLGATLRYIPPDGLGLGRARLVFLDRTYDRALLAPVDARGLVPLPVSAPPNDGDAVLSASSYFSAQALGVSIGELSGGWYGTTQRVQRGWSGSPALSKGRDGVWRVWGILAKCMTYANGPCVGDAEVTVLP